MPEQDPSPEGRLADIPAAAPLRADPAPSTVVLYRRGRPVYVPQEDVEQYLRDGFRRSPVDVEEATDRYRLTWRAAWQTGLDYAEEAAARGHLRREATARKALAEQAHALAAQAWLDLHQALQLTYPTLEEGPAGPATDGDETPAAATGETV